MNAVQVGMAIGAILIAVLGLILDRRDKRKAAENEIQTIPDDPAGVDATLDRVRRIEAAQHIQPERNP